MGKKIVILGLCLMLVISLASMALAVDRRYAVTGSSSTTGVSSSWNETAAGSDVGQGGNVTNMNLSTTASTIKWQGYYGQVEATLGLGGDGNARTLYSFGAAQNDQIKAVYASTDSGFNFAALAAVGTASDLDTVMGWPTADSDSSANTFDDSTQTISRISGVNTVNLNSYNSEGAAVSTVYHSGLFSDGGSATLGDYAFGVQVNSSTNYNFLNTTIVDYELVVAVNSTAQHGETPLQKTYFFFLDIE